MTLKIVKNVKTRSVTYALMIILFVRAVLKVGESTHIFVGGAWTETVNCARKIFYDANNAKKGMESINVKNA